MWYQKKCFRQCVTERGHIEHVILKRYSYFFFTGVGKSVIFQLSPFVSDSWHESTKSSILASSLIDTKSNKTISQLFHIFAPAIHANLLTSRSLSVFFSFQTAY